MFSIHDFPHINAALNATSTVLLLVGYIQIRRQRWRAHATLMIAATITSAAFLACYLYYHYHAGEQSTRQMTWLPHWLRMIYLAILFPHLLLATAMLPIIALTLWRAAARRWDKHRRIARPTLIIWLYVSVSGVAIYWMLYHLFPSLR